MYQYSDKIQCVLGKKWLNRKSQAMQNPIDRPKISFLNMVDFEGGVLFTRLVMPTGSNRSTMVKKPVQSDRGSQSYQANKKNTKNHIEAVSFSMCGNYSMQ